MPRLRLAILNQCPPDGFRFTDPDTGHVSSSLDKRSWLKAIAKHRADNGLAPIDEADVIDQFCKLLPSGWAVYENGDKPAWAINTRLSVRDVLNGTKALASFIVAGTPLVSQELAASRSAICARCPFNIKISGCAPCLHLAEAISKISGSMKTPSDASLRSCAICHCSNKAQTRLQIETLAKGVNAEMRERFNSVDFCWKRQELETLDNANANG